ncbi:hypothetical protein vBVpP1_45 [Vibrio phage vB_VpP_1]|nr:hypothetical protein vBVpP1_45 [Vibrio phage vB_VpP_1]
MNTAIKLVTETPLERIKSAIVSYDEYTEIHQIANPKLHMGLKALEYYLEGGKDLTTKELTDIKQSAIHEAKVEQRFANQCCEIGSEGANITALDCANDILEAIEGVVIE